MRRIFKPINILIASITLCAFFVFGITFKNAVIAAPSEPEIKLSQVVETATSTAPIVSSYPSVLSIPSLGINAHVQKVGISIHGTMAVPNNFTDVGWYKYGTIPGNPGNAVFAGHLDNGLSLAGVFKHLGDIQIGSDIYVTTAAGDSIHYVVTGTSTLDYNATATESIFGTTTQSQLKLITCEGTWDESHKTYTNRLVVTAQKD